jgi:hypothetical protein
MLRKFGWFPVTVIRDEGTSLTIAAHYDDVEGDVALEDAYDLRYLGVGKVIELNDQSFRFETEYGRPVHIRQTIAQDAASWDYLQGRIDLPVEIIGAIMTAAVPEPTLTAAIDDEGEVHTMVLETSLGLYARYARTWIRMMDISPIEALEVVDVPSDDLGIYDDADDAGKTVNIRDMHPKTEGYDTAVSVNAAEEPEPVAASAAGTVVVASAADLPAAIEFAATSAGVASRWYVERRARALGHTDPLPWESQ